MKSPSSFIAITSEGGLLPADFLHELPDPKTTIEGVTPVAYHLAEGERLNEQINRSWNRLKGCWENFKKAVAEKTLGDPTTTDTRERWLFPLFQELGFGRLTAAKPIEVDGRSYPVSHAWNQVPIHLVGSHADLDHRTPGAIGASKASPYSLVQSALNASDAHLWGIVSNGFNLRLLRDNIALTRLAFIEFDLQAMFDGDLYSEFFVLWLVCHQSRFEGEKTDQCWLERWKKSAEDKTLRALDDLYPGVKMAIAVLGAGLVSNRANGVLLEKLRTGRLSTQEFYKQVLRVIYRLLFLLVAEDRDLLHLVDDTEAGIKARRRYRQFYSITRLRALTLSRAGTPHPDLWQVFQLVTAKLGSDTGCPEIALPPLGSYLWTAAQSTPDLLDSLISNRHFLEAIHALAFVQDNNVRRAVDYKNLGSEELGSVYQGLLEMHPRINADAGSFDLDIAAGNERKTSGSYYTPDSLVQCLLDSALEPVISERLAKAKTPREKETALLSLKVCDKAAGSGHFIIRAGHRIARHLARVRSGEEEPSPTVYRTALRDVIGHCLYGVDINPMAVELCKVTLWLEALEPGKPLSFLDHHIRCGNSLLGATPELIKGGIPDETYEAIEGDDKEACAALKKKNKRENPKLGEWFAKDEADIRNKLFQAAAAIDEMGDNRPEDIRRKEAAFCSAQSNYDFQKAWDLADLWCAAFVIKKRFADGANVPASRQPSTLDEQPLATQGGLFGGTEELPNAKGQKAKAPIRVDSENAIGVTTQHLRDFVEGGELPDGLLAEAKRLADRYQFFHWHLAFPEVFAQGGFDLNLGNPPWDMQEVKDNEFFAGSFPEILSVKSAKDKALILTKIRETTPSLWQSYQEYVRVTYGQQHLMANSGRFPLSATGRMNLYRLFLEAAHTLASKKGRVGIVVPSGFASDSFSQDHFAALHGDGRLVSLFDFENRSGLFPSVHSSYRFCLLTIGGKGSCIETDFVFFAHSTSDLAESDRHIRLSAQAVLALNPLTKTAPLFRSRRDYYLTLKMQNAGPIIGMSGGELGWGIRPILMFMMNAEMKGHRTADELQNSGCRLSGNCYLHGDDIWLPFYEGKMVGMFDHRAASIRFDPSNRVRRNQPVALSTKDHEDPAQLALPMFWVNSTEVADRCTGAPEWCLAVKDVTSSTNERTSIAAMLASVALTDSLPWLRTDQPARMAACLLANLNSFAFDYAARQKVAGLHLRGHYLGQLPIIGIPAVQANCIWAKGSDKNGDWILPRVLELTYTAWDLEAFAQECGCSGPPFRWNEERRFLLRCELDAAFFHLYLGQETEWIKQPEALTKAFPTPRHAVDYILDTFPIVKRKDEAKFDGAYRTKRVILEIYDALAESMKTGKSYQTRLNPGPASIGVAHPPRFDRERVDVDVGNYILTFVFSLLRHHGGECDVMRLARAYALLLQRETFAQLSEAQLGLDARLWVERFSQVVDARWFLPILRQMDTRGMVTLEVRGEDVVVRQKDPQGPPSNATVETDVFLVRRVLDIVPATTLAEPVKRIVPKAPRVALQEAVLPA